MRRIVTGLVASLLLGGLGCRHCCSDRPRLFDDTRNRDPDCRDNFSPNGQKASAPKLGTPLRGQEVGLSGGTTAYPVLPTYTAPVVPFVQRPAADLLPPPSNIPPTDLPIAPPSPAVPGAALLPPPSVQPVGR